MTPRSADVDRAIGAIRDAVDHPPVGVTSLVWDIVSVVAWLVSVVEVRDDGPAPSARPIGANESVRALELRALEKERDDANEACSILARERDEFLAKANRLESELGEALAQKEENFARADAFMRERNEARAMVEELGKALGKAEAEAATAKTDARRFQVALEASQYNCGKAAEECKQYLNHLRAAEDKLLAVREALKGHK